MVEVNNTTKSKINLKLIKTIGEEFLNYYKKKDFDVSIAFVGDKKIRELNNKYRKKDKVTDILSFEGKDFFDYKLKNKFLGEIIIDYVQVKRQKKKSKSLKEELVFILVHGFLHLIGYKDDTEKEAEEMEKMGIKFIKKISNKI